MIFEKVKSGLMFLLFSTCMILATLILYDFQGSSSQSESSRVINQNNIQYEELFYPQSCSMSFGGGLYKGVFSTAVKQDLWQESRKYIKNYADYLEINKMTQNEWDTAMKSKAVRFVMPFSMSVNQLQSLLLEKELKSDTEKMFFDTIIMPINDDQTIFLGNRSGGEYYLLRGVKRDGTLSTLMSQYEKEVNAYDGKTIEELYAPSKALAEPGKPFAYNQVLFPVTSIPSIPFVRVDDELSVSKLSEQELKQYVSKAFGSRNDFLKKVEDIDGSLVYLYGYGDRALRIGNDGIITYKRRFEKQLSSESYTFKEGVTIAVGELQTYGPLPKGFYLSGYKESKDKDSNLVKQFTFNYEMENLPIYLESDSTGQPMVVEITGKQITSVKRKLSNYLRTFSVGEIWDEPMAVLELFELNYDIVSKNFAKSDYRPTATTTANALDDPKFAFEMLQNIQSIDLVYFGSSDKAESLVPSWRVKVGSHQYIINIYSGEILKWIPPEGVK